MADAKTELTELATALGVLGCRPDETSGPPRELVYVSNDAWERLLDTLATPSMRQLFEAAYANGRAFADADDGLRGRVPRRVEWKGPHRAPIEDPTPADLRVDRVFLISCKYRSKVLANAAPSRVFEHCLREVRSESTNWFLDTAPYQFQQLFEAATASAATRGGSGVPSGWPRAVQELDRAHSTWLRDRLRDREWPVELREPWLNLCAAVSLESSRRWAEAAADARSKLQLLWRLLRISSATYFVLGTHSSGSIRVRVDSAWDWAQRYELLRFGTEPRTAGQPVVAFQASVGDRATAQQFVVEGHVEIRWSHGRFSGAPEAKIYLDTPQDRVPGYHRLG